MISKHVKNLELFYENKVESYSQQRPKVEYPRSRLQQLNFWKMFIRIPRPNSYSMKPVEEKVEEKLTNEQEKLMVISSFKNSEHSTPSPKKYSKVQKNYMKRYISDEGLITIRKHEQRDQTSIRQIQKNMQCKEDLSDRDALGLSKDLPSLAAEYHNQSELVLNKRSLLDANCSQNKGKYRINRQFVKKQPINTHTDSKLKLPELKEEKRYPILMKGKEDLKEVRSDSFIIVEYPTQRIIVSHRSAVNLQIASLTKIMTFYTVIKIIEERSIDIKEEQIVVSSNVLHITGTSAELIEGEIYSVEAMLYGLMLPSGNDAANELAFWAGAYLTDSKEYKAQQKAFVAQMNRHARNLNLINTKFANPHGLPHQEAKSTASDVAKLCCVCMKEELFRTVVGCKMYRTAAKSGDTTRLVEWENTNKLLRRQGFVGIKTGITVTAGPCLAAAYTFRDKTYISVILRAPKISARFKQTRLLLCWALFKLYKDTNEHQRHVLRRLRRHDQDLDSDNSEDEHEFNYDKANINQFKRRCNILNFQL